MRKLIILIFFFSSLAAVSQTIDLREKAGEIMQEGKLLYRLELAAWHGSDIFRDSFKENERIGGYFSYMDNDTPKCLFFSRGENPRVLGVVSFGDLSIVETATIDFKERDFKDFEKDLYVIRTKALLEIQQDTIFKTYSNSSLNLIPVFNKDGGKVYVLTAPQKEGVVLFGNDYLLTFDKVDNLIEKKQIHRNLIPIYFGESEGKEVVATVHSHAHETGDFITPTDICTLMLYARFAEWKRHFVISENYVSIWDVETETLKIITREDFEKMKEE